MLLPLVLGLFQLEEASDRSSRLWRFTTVLDPLLFSLHPLNFLFYRFNLSCALLPDRQNNKITCKCPCIRVWLSDSSLHPLLLWIGVETVHYPVVLLSLFQTILTCYFPRFHFMYKISCISHNILIFCIKLPWMPLFSKHCHIFTLCILSYAFLISMNRISVTSFISFIH